MISDLFPAASFDRPLSVFEMQRLVVQVRELTAENKLLREQFQLASSERDQLKELVARQHDLLAISNMHSSEFELVKAEWAKKEESYLKTIDTLVKKAAKPVKTRRNSHQSSEFINPPKKPKAGTGNPGDAPGGSGAAANADGASDSSDAANADGGSNGSGPAANAEGVPGPATDEEPKRKIGAQPGHTAHQHVLFDLVEASLRFYEPSQGAVCECGSAMEPRPLGSQQRMDQYELPVTPIERFIHIANSRVCPACGKVHEAAIPDEVRRQGMIGERLTAFIATLNTSGRVTLRAIQEVLKSMGADISLGCLSGCLFKLAKALEGPYLELFERLKTEPVLNIDETGHKENGKRLYTWGFNAKDFVVFVIGFRSADILETVLTNNYEGVIGCDYYSAYRAFFRKNPQASPAYCHAHLVRELLFLEDHELEPEVMEYARKLLALEKRLFELWHEFSETPNDELYQALRACAEDIRTVAIVQAPEDRKAQAISKRFIDYPDGYFTFIEVEGVEPTNNIAERGFRFIAQARKISQGTRSKEGRYARERLWTAFATCRKRAVSIFEYFFKVIAAVSRGEAAPSLLS